MIGQAKKAYWVKQSLRVADEKDGKLRELKDNYGEYLCNEVVRLKLEIQDLITIDTGEAPWNFVEDIKATEEEAMDVLLKIHRIVKAVKNKSCSSTNEPVLQQDGGNASQGEQTTRRRTAMEDSSACAQSHHVEPILKALVEIRKYLVEEIAEADAEAMYSEWTRHVKSIHWHPFKFDNSEGTPKRVVDENDAKLRELKDNYGQYLCNEVVRVKLEIHDLIDIGNLETLWSFVEDRKAAEEEAMDVILKIDRIVKTVKNKSCSSANEPVLQQDGGNASQREQTTTRRTAMERSNHLVSRKKLLVLDLNGLLADIGFRQTIHKRPSCEDFLNFCFDKFEVGVWSSKIWKNVEVITDQLLGDLKEKLVFCWDQNDCTKTTVGCPERNQKRIVFKNLNKLWEKQHPDIPWKNGDYNKTIIFFVSFPYTAIFPQTYNHQNQTHTSLGSGGDLRLYLEKLVEAENVQEFIKKNPFGQEAITEASNCWETYKLAISSVKEETSN
ncbi:hypothetical protein Bca52824_022967 [Brassica carinata]|uniref:FCP1 homology domain-containing protein n=1 Tax=Brassica carinata TaxID=52824 RepID=A0A8X8ASF6_BRACI|nr:hypothetical protein Bca52824_022967 [Brassica carinata]